MNSLLKIVLALLLLLVASDHLPEIHHATRILFAERMQKGFSSLEHFNDRLWGKRSNKK